MLYKHEAPLFYQSQLTEETKLKLISKSIEIVAEIIFWAIIILYIDSRGRGFESRSRHNTFFCYWITKCCVTVDVKSGNYIGLLRLAKIY